MSETIKTRIKRVGQFLHDNAGFIATKLCESPNFRTLGVGMLVHKSGTEPELDIELRVYDEKTSHFYFKEDEIYIKRFREVCAEMNRAAGVNQPKPEPVEVRDER